MISGTGHSTGGVLQPNFLLSAGLRPKSEDEGSVPFKREDQERYSPKKEDWPYGEQQISTITVTAKEC